MKILNLLSIQQLWQQLVKWTFSSQEIQVWQELDREGRPCCWHVYDPLTGRSGCFGSQEEIRMWIEQRYYSHKF